MRKEYAGIISRVNEGSLAEELELVPGDKIIAINEQLNQIPKYVLPKDMDMLQKEQIPFMTSWHVMMRK